MEEQYERYKKELSCWIIVIDNGASTMPAVGMTLCGHYEITGSKVGIRAWADGRCSHGHKSAGVKLVEGSYNSGWKYGKDVTVSKTNNPLYTAYTYYTLRK